MDWSWFRHACLVGVPLLSLVTPIRGHAQVESREGIALQNQIYQLRQDLQILRSDVARVEGSGGGGGGDAGAQLLPRVQALEEQMRQLRGKIDEAQNLVIRQNAELSKRIDDLTFQLNLSGKGATVSPPVSPSPPPVREATPRPAPGPEPMRQADATPRPGLPYQVTIPAATPTVIPPPPPPPPLNFTFNQTPEPMRESPPPQQARVEPPKPTVRPPDQTSKPAVLTPEARVEPPKPTVRPRDPTPQLAAPTQEARVEPLKPAPRPPDPVVKPAPLAVDTTAPEPTDVSAAIIPPGGKRTPELALQEGHAALARRDYAAAERAAREVMANRASPRAYDGQFLLAQALSGEKQFAQAAIAYDDTYNRSHKGRHAQDAMIGLVQALTAINEKKAACDTLGRMRTEFPEVRADLRDTITKTNERAGCGR